VQLGEALDVGLVDDRLVVGDVERAVALPVEERVDHHAVQHVRGGVVVVARVLVAEVVAEQRLVPVDVAGGGLRVGVEQQLGRVAPDAVLGVPRAVHAVAVALSGLHVGQVAVPDVGVDLGQLDPGLVDRAPGADVEEAQLDSLGDLAEEREVGPAAVERRAERVGLAGPDLHRCLLVVRGFVTIKLSGCRVPGPTVPTPARDERLTPKAPTSGYRPVATEPTMCTCCAPSMTTTTRPSAPQSAVSSTVR
jgi:hypothetical protein